MPSRGSTVSPASGAPRAWRARRRQALRLCSGVPAVEYFRLTRDGDLWVCECEGKRFHLRDSRGMQMLARLVAHRGATFTCSISPGLLAPRTRSSMLAMPGSCWMSVPGATTASGWRNCRRRSKKPRALGDAAAAEEARAEFEQLRRRAGSGIRPGGACPRRAGSAVERGRVNVQRRLKDAQSRIGKESPAAGRHLEWAIRTGLFLQLPAGLGAETEHCSSACHAKG